ncbi:MAG: type II toxin-antitoxin system VapC family toxin [Thermoanaerobaculia bacterium]
MLVDTSVWIDHFRRGNSRLAGYLEGGEVESHPFIVGELACGNLRRRVEVLELLAALPSVPTASHEEVLALVDRQRLAGTGLGWVDVHLLCSALLAGCRLWTLDRRLRSQAENLDLV